MDYDLKINIFEDPTTNFIKVIFFRNVGINREFFNFYNGESEIIEPNNEISKKFIMSIPSYLSQEFLQRLVEILDKKGIKSENDNLMKGKLDATKYHLEDLRKLLKLEKNNVS